MKIKFQTSYDISSKFQNWNIKTEIHSMHMGNLDYYFSDNVHIYATK